MTFVDDNNMTITTSTQNIPSTETKLTSNNSFIRRKKYNSFTIDDELFNKIHGDKIQIDKLNSLMDEKNELHCEIKKYFKKNHGESVVVVLKNGNDNISFKLLTQIP